MITECDAETRQAQQRGSKGEIKPVKAEVPQIERYRRQGEKKSTDQERAGRPVDPVSGNAKNQGGNCGGNRCRDQLSSTCRARG